MERLKKSSYTRTILGLILSTISAGLLMLAFPPFNLWFLVWFSFIPYILAEHRVMPNKISSLAPAVFIGLFFTGYNWQLFQKWFGFEIFLVFFLVLSVFIFLILIGSRRFHKCTHFRWFVIDAVVGWVGFEMIRNLIPFWGSWGFVAYTLHSQPWLIQPASILGVFGVSALIIMVNYVLGMAAILLLDKYWKSEPDLPILEPRVTRRCLVIAGAIMVVWIGLSLIFFRTPQEQIVRVAVIQPYPSHKMNKPRNMEDILALLEQIHVRMIVQTHEAAEQGAKIIVWPETMVLYDPQKQDPLGLVDLAKETGTYLVIGYSVQVKKGVYRNEATVISPSGKFLGIFGKDHPVAVLGQTSFTRGKYPVYETPIGVLGTIICYDLDFTDTARKLAKKGAQLIAIPSQDGPTYAHTHYTHVVFRAVENRMTMIKADGGFDSAIIDPYGRVLKSAIIPKGGEATLVADVPLGSGDSIAVRLGDWFGWICLIGILFFTFSKRWLIKRAKKIDKYEA